MSSLAIAMARKVDGSKAGIQHGEGGLHGDDEFYLNHLVSQIGGAIDDYALYRTSDPVIAKRIADHDEWVAVLDGQGNINSLDFSIEDARLLVVLSTNVAGNKIRALPDGTYDPINIIAQVYEPDGETLNTTYTGLVEINVRNPNKMLRFVEATITNGVLETPFTPRHLGMYTIYEIKKNGTKLKEPLEIKVYHEAVSV